MPDREPGIVPAKAILREHLIPIRKRLIEDVGLSETLAKFCGRPAIFLQDVPDDKSDGWGDAQYPRITFSLDSFSHASRDNAGSLSIDISCSEAGKISPEEIEPFVKRALSGVFFAPDRVDVFSATWRGTEAFTENRVHDREPLIIGMSMDFDVFSYPSMETGDPDPIAAINRYALEWDSALAVIGTSELNGVFVPTRENPAIYFRPVNFARDTETCSVVWMNGEIAAHLFAPTLKDRREWLDQFLQSLAYSGEIKMLDRSPMFIRYIRGDTSQDENAGQLKIGVRYGLLRKPVYAHTMMKAIMTGGKISGKKI